jgi:CheY-like chemotaxis protein
VIFVTAKITPPEVARYLAAGAVGVVEKPFDPMRLSSQVQALVAAAASASAGVKPHA